MKLKTRALLDCKDDGRSATGVLDRGFGLAGLGLAGVVENLTGGVGLAGDAAEPFLDHKVHIRVDALAD
jgi:hypothetical protein